MTPLAVRLNNVSNRREFELDAKLKLFFTDAVS